MQGQDVLFSSKSNEWETPQDLFDKLDSQCHFTLDPCCTHENAKCLKHYTQQENGLLQDWSNDIVFCNPPYGREIGEWVKKAYDEAIKGAKIVMLIPARVDTKWFHQYIYNKETEGIRVEFIKGRLKFTNRTSPTWKEKTFPATFPSMLVYFNL